MIYFLRAGDDGPVKIGTAIDPEKRKKGFRTASYTKLSFIRLIDGGRKEEVLLYRYFRHLHIQGEWFSYDDEMLVIDPANINIAPIQSPPAMPNARFKECLKIIGWSARKLSKRLKCDTAIINRWALGTAQTPPVIAEWLERLAEDTLANPPPTDWRVRPVREAAE